MLLDVNLTIENGTVIAEGARAIGIVAASDVGTGGDFVYLTSLEAARTALGGGPALTACEAVFAAESAPVAVYGDATATRAYGTAPVVVSNGGTLAGADVTYDATQKPSNRGHVSVRFTADGTIGTAGIKYQIATRYNPTDADYGSEIDLGTATSITAGPGIKLNLAATKTVKVGTEIQNAEGLCPVVADATITAAITRAATHPARPEVVGVISPATSSATLAAMKAGRVAARALGRDLPVIGVVGAPTRTTTPAAFLASVSAVVAGFLDEGIAVFASEAETPSLALHTTALSALSAIARLPPTSDLRAPAAPAAVGGTGLPDAATSGPAWQSLRDAVTSSPLGSWDEGGNASSALSLLRVGALRSIAQFTGAFIADSPVLSASNTAIEQIDHARAVAAAYGAAYLSLFSVAGQKLRRFTEGEKRGRLVPYAADQVESQVSRYVDAVAPYFNGPATFQVDRTANVPGRLSGVLSLPLLDSVVRVDVAVSASR